MVSFINNIKKEKKNEKKKYKQTKQYTHFGNKKYVFVKVYSILS